MSDVDDFNYGEDMRSWTPPPYECFDIEDTPPPASQSAPNLELSPGATQGPDVLGFSFGASKTVVDGGADSIQHPVPSTQAATRRAKSFEPEFFGVYCLVSKSPLPQYKNRCYIGYTVDPNRRIRQHNGGKHAGGAKKTDNRGPWDMVCVVHGFPNNVSGLRFEWAWQNPDGSRRLRDLGLKKVRNETPFAFRLRIVSHMLNSDPWKRLSLTFRWLIPSYELPFPPETPLPSHMLKRYGLVEKATVQVSCKSEDYAQIRPCGICKRDITMMSHLVRCQLTGICGAPFHAKCLAETALDGDRADFAFPVSGKCPRCRSTFRWGDVIRDQRSLIHAVSIAREAGAVAIGAVALPKDNTKNSESLP